LPVAPVGTLLKAETAAAPGLHGRAYRVMYLSRSVQNRIVAVTGTVIVPDRPAPGGGYPVVTWGHGTNGMADQCAPSLSASWSAPPPANALLDVGFEITASDYQGEGTAGVLPYLAGVSAARNVIDIVRAARQLAPAHASRNYVVWGYSEGGQAAMFALNIADAYAPDLHLEGDIAGAPPSQFDHLYSQLRTSPNGFFLLMIAVGLNSAYGDAAAPLDELLTPAGTAMARQLETVCLSDVEAARLSRISYPDMIKPDPFTRRGWRSVLMANDPQSVETASATPLLIVQGGADTLIVPSSTQTLAKHLCGIGQSVERWVYPAQSHAGALVASAGDVIHWIVDQFTGVANPDLYVPTGQNNVQQTRCPM
jgi:alpha-beta hydrolase superfamily lysophospholipase